MKRIKFKQQLFAVLFSAGILVCSSFQAYAADFTGKKIVEVNVSGSNTMSTESIKAVVKLKPGDVYNAETIKQDLQAIYKMGSFYNVQAQFSETTEGLKINYSIVDKIKIKEVVFEGNTVIPSENLQELIRGVKNEFVDAKKINDISLAIEQYYHDKGYILAKVNDSNIDQEGTLRIGINEGIVEDIVIKGNDKTKAYVINRQIKLKKGQPFNAKDAKRSLQRINNLGFFEDVNIKLNPGREPNAVVVVIDVKEQPTGTFGIGGGYSKSDGFATSLSIGDKNFNGTGNKASITYQHGISSSAGTGWDVNFTNPWIDDKQTSLSVDFFNSLNEYSDYGYNGDSTKRRSTYYRRARGFNITIGRPEGEYTRNYLTFTRKQTTYEEYVSGPVNYLETDSTADDYDSNYNSDYLKNNFGTVHSVTLSRVYDTRDNIFNPTEGKYIALTSEFAGKILGGQFDYNKYTADVRQHNKVGRNQTMAYRLVAGWASDDIPDSSKFTVGGINTLRGYKDDEFTGSKMFTATVEYRYPIVNKVQGVIFADAGNAWNGSTYNLSDLKYSIGTGLRMTTPIGPLRLDFGYGKEGGRCHFDFGGQF